MTTSADFDRRDRERIEKETGKNFLVEANAGSGKTYELVRRMVALVKSGEPVSSLCAITFTKAAAREFYRRFQEALTDEWVNGKDMRERQLCAEALQNIDLCFMNTIDSFAQTILREHPSRAELPADARIRSVSELKAAYSREYSAIMAGDFGEVMRDKCLALGRFYNDPRAVFVRGMGEIISHRHYIIPHREPMPEEDFERELKRLLPGTARLMEAVLRTGPFAAGNPAKSKLEKLMVSKKALYDERSSCEDMLDALTSVEGYEMYEEPAKAGLPDKLFSRPEGNEKKYTLMIKERSALYKLLREQQYSVALDALIGASGCAAHSMKKRGELDFYDCLLFLRDMLRTDAANGGLLIRHIQKRRKHYLIDEFQDTDPLQAQIFFYLTAQEPHEDWRKCVPKPGSLFIVGDPKQSIYRFKSADVRSYKTVKELFADGAGDVLLLRQTFRTTDYLARCINELFDRLMAYETPDQCAYMSVPVGMKDKYKGGLLGIYSYTVAAGYKYDSYPKDSKRLAQLTQKLITSGVTIDDKGKVRPVRWSDIMIVTPTTSSLGDIMDDMALRGIPVRVEGMTAFSGCPMFETVTAVMGGAAFPWDGGRVYKALLSKAFGVNDREIMALRARGLELKAYLKSESLKGLSQRLINALGELGALAKLGKSVSPAVMYETIISRLRLPVMAGSRGMEYLVYAGELLRQAQAEGTVVTCADGARMLDRLLRENGRDVERCAPLSREENCVHIANLHKVKGLEAPIVILASPHRKYYDPQNRADNSKAPPEYRIFSGRDFSTGSFPEELGAERQSDAAEKVRLLYVAATRARYALIVADSRDTDGKASPQNPWGPVLALPHRELLRNTSLDIPERPAEDKSGPELWAEGERESLLKDGAPEESTYRLTLPSKLTVRKVAHEEAGGLPKELARAGGTLIHRLMEVLVSSGGKAEPGEVIEEIMTDAGRDEEELRDILRVTERKLREGGYPQKNGLPADILGETRAAEQVLCEVPFCVKRGDEIVNGVMDLAYLKDGKWQIVDYKTGAETEADEAYGAQLAAYGSAFKELTGEEAEVRAYVISN